MPSAKSRVAKAVTAARVAAYNAAAAALESELQVKATSIVGIGKMNISGRAPDFEDLTGKTSTNTVAGVFTSANTPMPFKPTLPSMLNLNTSPNTSRALAVGAVVVGAEQTGNPSDEENVQPIIPGITPASTISFNKAEERSARPLSPILGNIDNERDMRAYEFERQKVRRAGEFAKRKAAKAAKTGGYVSGGGGGHSYTGRAASEGSVGDGGRKDAKSRIGPNDMDVDMLFQKPVAKIASRIDRDMPRTGQIEVSLSELVLRQKKPRKIKEDDFEMISPVRPVIVLDDLEAKDMDMDEPWEHVERDFEPGKKPKEGEPSYAAVLLGIAH